MYSTRVDFIIIELIVIDFVTIALPEENKINKIVKTGLAFYLIWSYNILEYNTR